VRQVDGGEGRRRETFEAGDEPLGLVQPALCDPELGEGRRGQRVRRGLRGLRFPERRRQLGLGLGPVARRHEHGSVEHAAVDVEERAPVPLCEPIRGSNPLDRALELGAADAGADHVAAGVDDRVEVAAFTSERGGHRLVEQREALVHPPLANEAGAGLGERAELEIEVSRCRGQLARLAGQPLAVVGIVALARLEKLHPAEQVRELVLLDEPPRPREPAGRCRCVGQVRAVVHAEAERDRGRLSLIAAAAEVGVRTLAVGHRFACLPEPPERLAEAVEGLSGFAYLESRPECVAGLEPVPGLQRGGSRAKRIGSARHSPHTMVASYVVIPENGSAAAAGGRAVKTRAKLSSA
jgi:hypothetical protein